MPMTVVYATVNGRLVQEKRGGNVTRYVADTLGSVIQTRDASGNQTSSTTYWPFGEVRTSSGTNPSPWGFCGTLGYFKDTLTRMYVRLRMFRPDLSRWLSPDPYWPNQRAYEYALNAPVGISDPSGLRPYTEKECDAIYDNWKTKCDRQFTGCLSLCGIAPGIGALCIGACLTPEPVLTKAACLICLGVGIIIGAGCAWGCVVAANKCNDEALAWYLRCLKKARQPKPQVPVKPKPVKPKPAKPVEQCKEPYKPVPGEPLMPGMPLPYQPGRSPIMG
jgi:RHS repeat-associated protein